MRQGHGREVAVAEAVDDPGSVDLRDRLDDVGVLAGNGQLVERAVRVLDAMNVRILGPVDTRARLGLLKR